MVQECHRDGQAIGDLSTETILVNVESASVFLCDFEAFVPLPEVSQCFIP